MIKRLIDFILELRILKYMKRVGLQFLKGPIEENLAEHHFYTTMIGWLLAKQEKADVDKVIKMALLHDIPEIRAGERNLINKIYTEIPDEIKVAEEITKGLGMEEILNLIQEFRQRETLEAKLVRDADTLAQMLMEKDCLDLGNTKAGKWLKTSLTRLKTETGKKFGKQLIDADADEWWMKVVKEHVGKTEFFQ